MRDTTARSGRRGRPSRRRRDSCRASQVPTATIRSSDDDRMSRYLPARRGWDPVPLRLPSRATTLAAMVIVGTRPAAVRLAAAGAHSPRSALASPRAAMINDGIQAFLLLLVLLLLMSLFAVIRLPRWAGPADGDGRPAAPLPARPAPPAPRHALPGHAWPAPVWPVPAWPVPAGSRPAGTQSGATPALSFPVRQPSGQPDPAARPGVDPATYPAPRPAAGHVPGRATVRSPKVSGSPPWGPAPRPPGHE
jgi:hypothetical protein